MLPKEKVRPAKATKTHPSVILNTSVDRACDDDEDFSCQPVIAPKMGDLPDEDQARRMISNGVPAKDVMMLLGLNPKKLARMIGREDDAELMRELSYIYTLRRGTTCMSHVLNFQPTSRK
jgi:hypothetical protein